MRIEFHKNVTVTSSPQGKLHITTPSVELVWEEPPSFQEKLFAQLVEGEEEEVLLQGIEEKHRALFYHILTQLNQHALLLYRVFQDQLPLCTLLPLAPSFCYQEERIKETESLVLSRFCFSYLVDQKIVLETSLEAVRIVLEAPEISFLLHALSKPITFTQLCHALPMISAHTVKQCLQLFKSAKMLCTCEENISAEERDPVFSHWEFHELLFHNRSRIGKHDNPIGGTYPFVGKWKPQLAFKSSPSKKSIELYKPDNEEVITNLLQKRSSVRVKSAAGLNAEQLGEFLFRTAKIQSTVQREQKGETIEFTQRLYPSGGELHSLEIYPVIYACRGLEQGIYHYEAQSHQLVFYQSYNAHSEKLLKVAAYASKITFLPDVLLIFSSRFQRVSWKYRSISYATILKEVGALMQTMYLVATALDLAPCALGMGDADLFAKLIQSNYFEESSVGEFMLNGPQEK